MQPVGDTGWARGEANLKRGASGLLFCSRSCNSSRSTCVSLPLPHPPGPPSSDSFPRPYFIPVFRLPPFYRPSAVSLRLFSLNNLLANSLCLIPRQLFYSPPVCTVSRYFYFLIFLVHRSSVRLCRTARVPISELVYDVTGVRNSTQNVPFSPSVTRKLSFPNQQRSNCKSNSLSCPKRYYLSTSGISWLSGIL